MDSQRFDSLVKSFARGANRRAVLKGLLGLGAGAVIAAPVLERETDAARRPTPTPKPVKCPQGQQWNGSECSCINGETCGSDCCLPGSECCDNACCYGHCYGEELCCSWDNWCEATNECCPSDTVCTECGCIDIDEGACCTNDDCPVEYECCGDQCCVSGYCAGGEMCCATGVCGTQCKSSPDAECCNGVEYDPETQVCCGDNPPVTGECCEDVECGDPACVECTNYFCREHDCG